MLVYMTVEDIDNILSSLGLTMACATQWRHLSLNSKNIFRGLNETWDAAWEEGMSVDSLLLQYTVLYSIVHLLDYRKRPSVTSLQLLEPYKMREVRIPAHCSMI